MEAVDMSMPGFTAEVALYGSGRYCRVFGTAEQITDGVQLAQLRGEIRMSARRPEISVADFHFQTAWLECFCSTTEGWCSCMPRREVITA
ncbi:MAG: hypothetical protein K0S36_2167 [Nitrosospira multiformis]|jgi:hypothetical protein|nr:hypothetical protein [Nitrosospira multiformis]